MLVPTFPCCQLPAGALLETGHDILFFWVARMVMMGMKLTGESVMQLRTSCSSGPQEGP